MSGYIKRIEDAKNKFADLPDRLALLEGMLISLKVVSARSLLYAKAYE